MYWRCGAWKPVKDDDARSVVDELGKQLAEVEGRRQTSLLRYDTQATSEMGQCPPSDKTPLISTSSKISTEPGQKPPTGAFQCRQVREVKYRTLPFYRPDQDWRLYLFTCPINPNQSDELTGYLPEAAFFAVRGPEGGIPRWTILDWTSTPLHRLNKMANLDFETSGKRVDYLLFFVSYLGSSEGRYGLTHPFVIPHSPCEIFDPVRESNKWPPPAIDETSPPLLSFDEFAAKKELTLFKAMDIDRDIDQFDIPEQDQPKSPEYAVERDQSTEPVRKIVEDFFEEGISKWFDEVSVPQANDQKPLFRFKAPMVYRGALFEATFSLDVDGAVLMVDDDHISGADWLPAPRWEVSKRQDGIHLLCLSPRRELAVSQLLEGKELFKKFETDEPIVVPPNTRISETIDKPRTIMNTLFFRNVEFMEDVVLDDWIFERSLKFVNCRFMRGLSLHNATINGSLILDRSEIKGAVEKSPGKSQKLAKHSLDLRGLKVDRLLSLDRLTVYGQLDGKGLRAANAVHGRGLQVSLRQNIDDPDRPALDFSYASISGPLLLEAHDDSKSDLLDPFRRTIVRGAVSFEGLLAKEVKSSGWL